MTSLLQNIISKTKKKPTIVNANSQYVICTYWWGRNNLNGNTARPCMSFYEEYVLSTVKCITELFFSDPSLIMGKNVQSIILESPKFHNVIANFAKVYRDTIYIKFGLLTNEYKANTTQTAEQAEEKRMKAIMPKLKKLQKNAKTSKYYVFRPYNEVEEILREIALKIIDLNKTNLYSLIKTYIKSKLVIDTFLKAKKNTTPTSASSKLDAKKSQLTLEYIKQLTKSKTKYMDSIKAVLKQKGRYEILGKVFENSNIYDILNTYFRYLEPVRFERMIRHWESECARNHCNYLSVEYPEFAKPGGYQMAINAKPLFIKKALELCGNRGVLYIDGDMYIRKYPSIFDIKNVDFMARGWSIDPRANDRFLESILYDPYTFETSGGTMFFSQSLEAKKLIDAWIDESDNPKQAGKADDRILSLVFNTKKFLLNVNIIQLPIEYLWLTMSYDEHVLEHVYDWDKETMESTILIEHPECLTSEDTASGAGASSDRTPAYYNFLSNEETFNPVSEEAYEFLMFPNKKMTEEFEPYHEFMSRTKYILDWNPKLIDAELVDPENPTNNKKPLYITNYEDKFGDRNEIVKANMKMVQSELDNNYLKKHLNLVPNEYGFIELDEHQIPGSEYQIAMIISLLSKGYNIIYKPTNPNPIQEPYPQSYESLLMRQNTNLEFVFYPIMNQMKHHLKPVINFTQPMLFRSSENPMLIHVLSMFANFKDFSKYFEKGAYHIMSRIRIGYVFKPKNRSVTASKMVGGSMDQMEESDKHFIQEYENGFDIMYGDMMAKKFPKTPSSPNNKSKSKRTPSSNKTISNKTPSPNTTRSNRISSPNKSRSNHK